MNNPTLPRRRSPPASELTRVDVRLQPSVAATAATNTYVALLADHVAGHDLRLAKRAPP
jgi:hypothetical protein